MYWQMFKADEADGKPFRLHLISEIGDSGFGPGTSFGYVEQRDAKNTWTNTRIHLKFTVQINGDPMAAPIDVPDLETGMAILLMNVKGN